MLGARTSGRWSSTDTSPAASFRSPRTSRISRASRMASWGRRWLRTYASKLYLIHRRKEFRASKIMIDRARKNEKIEFVTPFVVEEILAPQGVVEGVRLRSAESKETRELGLDGVFVAIGHEPNTTVFKGRLEMDSNGYLLAKHGSLTSIPGVFVAGDVQDHRYRQAVTAAGSGCMAAIDAEKFLEERKH